MTNDTLQIPLDSLSEDGTQPSVGDTCTIEVEGKVDSINGNMANITITKVHGDEVGENESAEPDDENMTDDQARQMGEEADNNPNDSY